LPTTAPIPEPVISTETGGKAQIAVKCRDILEQG
jgi:hypothetical protein